MHHTNCYKRHRRDSNTDYVFVGTLSGRLRYLYATMPIIQKISIQAKCPSHGACQTRLLLIARASGPSISIAHSDTMCGYVPGLNADSFWRKDLFTPYYATPRLCLVATAFIICPSILHAGSMWRVLFYSRWDSNPESTELESAASANSATRA